MDILKDKAWPDRMESRGGGDNGWKGQWGAISDQTLPAPGERQRLGVYKMNGRKGNSL